MITRLGGAYRSTTHRMRGTLFKYDMSSDQLQWFEGELQRLATIGYRWEHAYTQCVLQAMLYTLRQDLDPATVNPKICEHFADPKLGSNISTEDEIEAEEEPDETAFVRFHSKLSCGFGFC
ncbi:hypothetical protein ACJJTC_006627 [Scirpophaga incertulas]